MEEVLIRWRWQSYFHKLLINKEADAEYLEMHHYFWCCRSIKVDEVESVIIRMRKGRAIRPDKILMKVWKSASSVGIEWLTRFFNVIFKMMKMIEEWRWRTMIPLYKNKSGIQNCNNHRGVKLLSHIMKVCHNVFLDRWPSYVSLSSSLCTAPPYEWFL